MPCEHPERHKNKNKSRVCLYYKIPDPDKSIFRNKKIENISKKKWFKSFNFYFDLLKKLSNRKYSTFLEKK